MWNPTGGSYRRNVMTTFIQDESGATAIEYGVISALMFSLIMTAWGGVFFKIADAFDVVVTTLSVA
jgi:Flp pilus assembly pilin Flp